MAEWVAKRFWTDVSCVPEGGGFAIHLDTRPVRTPARASMILPTLPMARAIAAEWEAQGERIDPLSMPHTRSANAALDKVAPQREAVQAMIADYAATDLLCYRAVTPDALNAHQAQVWDPLLDWAADDLNAQLTITTGVMPVAQPRQALDALEKQMAAMSEFELTAFHELVSLSGSFVIGLAVVHRHLDAATGWALSRIDEEWQAEQWGRDEEADAKAAQRRIAFLNADDFVGLARAVDGSATAT